MRSHQPAIKRPYMGCGRVFSRKDNMVSGQSSYLIYSRRIVTNNRGSITRKFIYGLEITYFLAYAVELKRQYKV